MVVLLARWLPCSLLRPSGRAGVKRGNQYRYGEQIADPAERRSHAGVILADGWLLIGPLLRDHPLAAIGQYH